MGYSQSVKKSDAGKNFYIGIDNSGDKYKQGDFFNSVAMDSLGVDFVVWHYGSSLGTTLDEVKKVTKLGQDFKKANLKVIVNVESGNWNLNIVDKDGRDWVKNPGYPHIFKFPNEVLKSLSQSDAVWGIQYDELEHCQITRNISITLDHPDVEIPSLAETNGLDFKQADSALLSSARQLVEEDKRYGLKYVLGEHVWPVLFHNFARAGITPVYKQMKENWSNVWAACALGASLQYNRELWACLDFWHGGSFPGHSAAELKSNLLFAYWLGVDKAYVEAVGKYTYEIDSLKHLQLKERGEVFRQFAKSYVPANKRAYTFRDFEPEIAIIRFDDTEWGQGEDVYTQTKYSKSGSLKVNLYWKDFLFGAYNLRSSPASEEWIKAWSTITHGRVNQKSLSWNAANVYKDEPYRSFAPANAPVVFDQTVTKALLKNINLIFLCGLDISKNTLNDVSMLVKQKGITVVTSSRFAPPEFAAKYTNGTIEYKDGNGKWIITDNMASDELKNLINPLLGKDDEITLRFKNNKKVIMKISSNGKELQITKNDLAN